MNATNTTLCMLLAAAIGSAATATTLWKLQEGDRSLRDPTDPFYRTAESLRKRASRPPLPPGFHAPIPSPARPASRDDLYSLEPCKNELYDSFIKSIGEQAYIKQEYEGTNVAFTTPTAMDTYLHAVSNITPPNPPSTTDLPDKLTADLIGQTLHPRFGKVHHTAQGEPIIDYNRAIAVLREVVNGWDGGPRHE